VTSTIRARQPWVPLGFHALWRIRMNETGVGKKKELVITRLGRVIQGQLAQRCPATEVPAVAI